MTEKCLRCSLCIGPLTKDPGVLRCGKNREKAKEQRAKKKEKKSPVSAKTWQAATPANCRLANEFNAHVCH